MIEKNCQKLNEKNGVPKGKKSYNLSEIMAILGICRSSATKLIRTNQFRSVRIVERLEFSSQTLMLGLTVIRSKEEVQYGIHSKKKKQILCRLYLHG